MTSLRFTLPMVVSLCAGGPASASVEDSVVRVFASMRLPHPLRPWAKQNPMDTMGTGVVIDGKVILTNAHIVVYADEIFVQGREGGDRVPAKVQSIGLDADLATLTLEEEDFFKDRPPLTMASKRPSVGQVVTLYGYAVGNSGLSTTQGPVSRIEYGEYIDRGYGLRLQVNATAWPGNSGGPAVVDGKMAGLVFRRLENMAYVIPDEEILEYLEDVKDGRYDGKPQLTDKYQTLVNDALRKKLGLGRGDRGLLIREPGATAEKHPLRENDVLTHIGGVALDNEGMVEIEPNLRLPFLALVPRLCARGTIPVRLIREGKPLDFPLPVTNEDDRLIKSYHGRYPPYFVHGPLVFSPVFDAAVAQYAQANPLSAVGSPLSSRETDRVSFPGEELVAITAPMFTHKLMRGYTDPVGLVVKDVDGVPVKNLHHLVELLRDAQGEYLTLHTYGEFAQTLVFPRVAIEQATKELMAENGVPKRGTDDVMAVWNKQSRIAH